MDISRPYEIGSHFELDQSIIGDFAYTFSGRTAIELALKDISSRQKIRSVYMPSYCCSSMIQPFIDRKIHIKYYNVSFEADKGITYEIDDSTDCDIFFAMTYFGLEKFSINHTIESFSDRGIIIIEDRTHSLLSDYIRSEKVDYSIASIRKWLPIATGAYIIKHKGNLLEKPSISTDDIVKEKFQAMKEKHLYIKGENISKESFLEKFANFEKKFSQIDSRYKIDSISLRTIKTIDIEKIKSQRRRNGQVLYKGLEDLELVKPLIPKVDFDKACPLFIPIMAANGKRDDLRQHLISNNVYCPVHWPNEDKREGIEKEELSLICDQRYNEKDMEYILDLIREWQDKER